MKIKFTVFTTMIFACTALQAQPSVSISALGNKTNICSNGADFASLEAVVSNAGAAEPAYRWYKDGTGSIHLYAGQNYDRNNIRPTAAGTYTCIATINGNSYTSNSISITANKNCDDINTKISLPIIIVNTNGQGFPGNRAKTKRDVDVKILWKGEGSFNRPSDMAENNSGVHYDRKAIMNYRGSSSRELAKPPYALATGKRNLTDRKVVKDNVSLLGLSEEKDWILYPSYSDKSFIRNNLAMTLYREMGYYASNLRYVDLYIDNQYQGVYGLMEKLERGEGRINVTKDFEGAQPDQIGYIWKMDKTDPADANICWDFIGSGNGEGYPPYSLHRYELVYPGEDVDNFAGKKAYIKDFTDRFGSALYAANTAEDFAYIYENYIDLQSFADYFIIAELAKISDAYRLSMFFTKDADGKIKSTPIWDCDMGFGNSTSHDSFNTGSWQYNNWNWSDGGLYPIPWWWNKLRTNACFNSVVRTRWEELRQGALSFNNIEAHIDGWVNFLRTDIDNMPDSSPSAREKARWSWDVRNTNSSGNYIMGLIPLWPENYGNLGLPSLKTTSLSQHESPLMKAWIKNRLAWLDETIINNSFGDLLDDEQFSECCKTPSSVVTKSRTMQAGDNIIISAGNKQIKITAQEEIQAVSIYDMNGILLVQRNNVNSQNISLNVSNTNNLLIVKVLTKEQSLNKVVLCQ